MKSLQNVISARKLSLIQSLVSLAIMLAIVIMSFGTIFVAKVELDGKMLDSFNDMMEEFGGDEKVEFPEEIEFSAPNIISSISSIGKIIKSAFDTMKSVTELSKAAKDADDAADLEELEDKAAQAEDSMKSLASDKQGLINLVAIIVVMASAFKESVILGLIYFLLIGMTLVLPFVLAVKFIIALIGFLKNVNAPEEAYPRIAKGFGSMFGEFVVLLLLKMIAPQVEFGGVITGIVVLCAIGFVLNIIASRMKPMTAAQTKFLNVNQIVSLAGFGAFMMFFFSLTNTNLFNRIWERLGKFALENANKDGVMKIMLNMGMITVMIAMMFAICSYLQKVCCRMACMIKTGKVTTRDNYIVSTAISLLVVIIPLVLMNGDYKLKLNDDEMSAFTIYAIGVVLMLVVEIVSAALKKSLCKDLSHDDIVGVLSGMPVVEEKAAEAAPAEEAAAEEVPAEEAAAEEVPAEDAPVEEAPAEEVKDSVEE